ncbi:MAG: ribonuclease HII [Defluviitaleaceae bacterium]|nr:ribonuclease HII [Defluviitaleaceae bacterium]
MKTAPNICESLLAQSGLRPVAGIDEAGRGPLAGPVVACALVLPEGLIIEGVNDSKKVTALRREKLAAIIKENAVAYAFGIVDAAEIDRINILRATLLAMEQAVSALEVEGQALRPRVALVDGTIAPVCPCPVIYIVKGDSLCHLIAAASILAKVERDTIMEDLHKKYPEYGFDKHKGYGTAAHREALRQHGLCPQHRRSFCRAFL